MVCGSYSYVCVIQGVRGKMSSNCLWHACQALCVGMLLFSVGGVMSFLGKSTLHFLSLSLNFSLSILRLRSGMVLSEVVVN